MPNRASARAGGGAASPDDGGSGRDKIVEAAVAIADRDGLAAVSIRRLAAELDGRPMSLYTYIASKDDLLRLMADVIVAEVIVPEDLPSDWRRALTLIANRSHEAFVTHPWILEISGRRPHLGHNALRHAEQLLGAVSPLQLDPQDAWQILFLVNDFSLGHALRVAHGHDEPPNSYPSFEPSDYPRLAAALSDPGPTRGSTTFQAGLDLLLDGVEMRFSHRTADQWPGQTKQRR